MKKAEGRMQKGKNALRRVPYYFFMLPSSFCILLVRLYQLTLSPAITILFSPTGNCRFQPSCSQYAIDALKTHGPLAGGWLAAKRICRCHPWGEFGEDPVPPKRTPTLDTVTNHRVSIDVTKFLPLPTGLSLLGKQRKEFAEGEGPQWAERAGASESLDRGEGERIVKTTQPLHTPIHLHHLNCSAVRVHHHGS
jgi:hypothetical protein